MIKLINWSRIIKLIAYDVCWWKRGLFFVLYFNRCNFLFLFPNASGLNLIILVYFRLLFELFAMKFKIIFSNLLFVKGNNVSYLFIFLNSFLMMTSALKRTSGRNKVRHLIKNSKFSKNRTIFTSVFALKSSQLCSNPKISSI
jgi:hypothetical protein